MSFRPTAAMRLERQTLPLERTGENVFNKGDVVFEIKVPTVFKAASIMAVAPDLSYPTWYSWLGALRWLCFPWPVRETVTVNWKTRRLVVLRLIRPFRTLQAWLYLEHKRRVLGHVLVRSVTIDDREGLPISIPLLSLLGETSVQLNIPPVREGTCLKVVLQGGTDQTLERPMPEITVCTTGWAIRMNASEEGKGI